MLNPSIDLYIPTFGRASRLESLHNQINDTLDSDRIWFIIERDDLDTLHMCSTKGYYYIINHRSPSYAGAINSAWDCLQSDLFFAGADDLEFDLNWTEPIYRKLAEGFSVIGTSDGGGNEEVKRGEHATHYLVKGEYIKSQGGVIDGTAPVLPEVYDHNYTDREFIGTAKFRGVFTPCLESVVKHNHYSFGRSEFDETYRKTLRLADKDAQVYESRRPLWNGL